MITLPIESKPINKKVLLFENFMDDNYCDSVLTQVTDHTFPWFWGPVLSKEDEFSKISCPDNKNWQFSHRFYHFGESNSSFTYLIQPLIDRINPDVLFRAKVNMNPNEDVQTTHGFHTDINMPGLTSIFYLNDCNGKTILEIDGERQEILQKKGTLLTFDNRIMHTGTGTTDQKVRCLFVINHFKCDWYNGNV